MILRLTSEAVPCPEAAAVLTLLGTYSFIIMYFGSSCAFGKIKV